MHQVVMMMGTTILCFLARILVFLEHLICSKICIDNKFNKLYEDLANNNSKLNRNSAID